jgi:heptosyltransferase II
MLEYPVEERENILVRGVNWVGDAIMTLPALRAIRKAHPGARISLLVKPGVAPLFETSADIDEIILYKESHRRFFGRLQLALDLRRRRFSKAILLQNAFDAALIAFLAGIPERIGYDRDGRGFMLTRAIPHKDGDRKVHHIAYYLNLLNEAGIGAQYSEPRLRMDIHELSSARETLSGLARPVLGINPGSAYGPSKRWLPERFAEVAIWFIKETRGSVIIFGGKDETDVAEEIFRAIPMNKISVAGRTSLRELAALIAESDVFLTNDSGPMHIANAVGTPLVAIFGSTSPELTGPLGRGNAILRTELDCSPCFARKCSRDYIRCMFSVTSEEVYDNVRRMLPKKKAVFFDRDGTLCRDADYLNSWDDFSLLPGLDKLKELKDAGFELIGVSNQSGIARGVVSEPFVKEVNAFFVDKYGFRDFYYCPHLPDDHCGCRKPQPGMLLRARAEHGIDLRKSFVIGDKDADVMLAKTVGAKGIHVKTGQHEECAGADASVDDLDAAVKYILRWKE